MAALFQRARPPPRSVLPIPAIGSGRPCGCCWQNAIAGGTAPVWRNDGKEIFYLALDGKLMAVLVKPGATFGSPQPLFATRLSPQQSLADYDVTPDGQRFLINQPVTDTGNEPITVIVNWPELLKKGAGPP
jgi:hypothetical protein